MSYCDHCGQERELRYKVKSVEDDVVLLNMAVCQPCAREAARLNLIVIELQPAPQGGACY